MIPESTAAVIAPAAFGGEKTPAWQHELAQAIKRPEELLALLALDHDKRFLKAAKQAARLFPLRVPHSYVARMQKGDRHDPLLRQVLPINDELQPQPGYSSDPVGDLQAGAAHGLLHKYQGRALLLASSHCAVHCRYCFRRAFPYQDHNPAHDHWQSALAYIAGDDSLEEIILSGGDPLSLSDRRLEKLVQQLAAIPHVRRLRIHSRLPVVIPKRIDNNLSKWLTATRLRSVLVIHANHPQEISPELASALTGLQRQGITLLNQTVLLKDVNDNADTLAALSKRLFDAHVLPYYLHQLDKVTGAAHFAVPDTAARKLQQTLCERLPGYLVPKLVQEQAGAPAKRSL